MIELEHERVCLAAVDARVRREVIDQILLPLFADDLFSSGGVRDVRARFAA
jgi:hypothetical protein